MALFVAVYLYSFLSRQGVEGIPDDGAAVGAAVSEATLPATMPTPL